MGNQHGIKYEERINQPPVMVFWNEENAKRRQTAWETDGLDGGTVSKQTLHQCGSVVTHIIYKRAFL